MKKTILVISIFIFLLSNSNYAQKVHIIGKSFPKQMRYATVILEKFFYTQSDIVPKANADFTILLKIDPDGLNEEAYSISRNQKQIEITGGDGRGVIYGCQSIVEELQNGRKLNNIMSKSESTRLHFRAIKFDLPWDTYRHSGSLYQHQEICSDLKFWEAFLDMMCKNRFNALTLWNLHPYTFLIKPKNFPEASPWTDEEMDKWKSLFHGIFKLAKERGIDTYIMPFNIFVTPEFAKAHNVAMHNLDHHHFVEGDTSEIIKRYTRECVTQMLNEYPDLTGIGLTLGEGMGGMTPQQRENWISDTIIEGMRLADRKSKLIHRIPFSGNKGSLGATNIKMEQITRAGIEREAAMDCFEGPVWASLKFNWSHPLSTTKMIKVHGGKIYGTYWNPEPVGYKMVWTARNEDIFCLRWGVADFIREHIKTNAHQYVGGYFVGSETYIPAKDYFTKPAYAGKWKYAFERQWLFYKIWGRLLYNPDTPDTIFKNEFISRYGKGSEVLFDAFSLAGKTPLRLASSFDCTWDFTLYSEGFLALDPDVKRVDYISINRQINHPPLDTTYISIKEYVNMLLADTKIPEHMTTPPDLANALKIDCNKALEQVKYIDVTNNSALMYEVADVKTWANLGLYFSEKLKGGIDLQTYRLTENEDKKQSAITHLEKALAYWDSVIKITRPIYKDMPLVHFSEQDGKSWKENDHLRFHWALLRDDVAHDVEIAKNAELIK